MFNIFHSRYCYCCWSWINQFCATQTC